MPFTQGDEQKRLEAPHELSFCYSLSLPCSGFAHNVTKHGPTQGDQQSTGKPTHMSYFFICRLAMYIQRPIMQEARCNYGTLQFLNIPGSSSC